MVVIVEVGVLVYGGGGVARVVVAVGGGNDAGGSGRGGGVWSGGRGGRIDGQVRHTPSSSLCDFYKTRFFSPGPHVYFVFAMINMQFHK